MYSPQPAPHSCQGPGSDSQTSPGKVRCTVADSNPKNWLPHKYTRLDNSSNEVLCDLLAALEPITFSKFALRAIRTNKMKTLLELIEFACKVPRTTPLVGDLRHIPSLKAKLKEFAAGVDCRSHRIMLPPDWNVQGVYTLRADAHDNIVVSHRYTGTSRPWPAALRLKDDDGVAIASGHLYISGNFYEDAAEVRSGLTMESFRIGNLGCFDLRLEPPLKAMRLMVGDATSSDGVSGAGLALEDGRSVTSQSTPPPTLVAIVGSGARQCVLVQASRRCALHVLGKTPGHVERHPRVREPLHDRGRAGGRVDTGRWRRRWRSLPRPPPSCLQAGGRASPERSWRRRRRGRVGGFR